MDASIVPVFSTICVLFAAFDFYYCYKAFQKAGWVGRWIGFSALSAGVITLAYLFSISTYEYRLASFASSIYFLMIDWMLISLIHFTYVFADRQSTEESRLVSRFVTAFALLDSAVLLINVFVEIAIHYTERDTIIAHYGYEMKPLYWMHLIFTYALTVWILIVLIRKSLKTPGEYRNQYLLIVLAIALVVLVNAVFLYPENVDKTYTLLDFSILGYSAGLYLMYWAAFEYRQNYMMKDLSMTIFENIDQGIVLFDYSDRLIMHNKKADQLLEGLKISERMKSNEMTALCQIPEELMERDAYSVQCQLTDGSSGMIQCNFRRLRNAQNQIIGNLYVLSDASHDYDLLTGFQHWENFYRYAMENPYYFENPTSVVIFDIIGLGYVNRTFGRHVGDQRIRNLVRIMRRCMPEDTVFVRGYEAHLVAYCRGETESQTMEHVRAILDACGETVIYGICSTSRVPLISPEGENPDNYNEVHFHRHANELESDDILHATDLASHALRVKKLLTSRSLHSQTLSSLVRALQEADSDTEAHVRRTRKMGDALGNRIGLSDAQLADLKLLCLLHDIGKIGIPLEILNKPGKLTDEEWEVLKSHTEKGYQIAMSSDDLRFIAPMIHSHHERWDGKGYPEKLAGHMIPLLSRIIAIVDAYDAMVNDRAYRKGLTPEKAQEEIRVNAGTQFDPYLAEEFLQMLQEEPDIALGEQTGGESVRVFVQNAMEIDEGGSTHPIPCSRYLLDLDEKIIEVDDLFEEITGYTREETIGKMSQFDLVPAIDRAYYTLQVNNEFTKGTFAYLQHNLQRKDGEIIQVVCYGKRYFDSAAKAYRSEILVFPIRDGMEIV